MSSAIRIKPRSAELRYRRGTYRRSAMDYAGALLDLNRAIQLDPNHADALFCRGGTHQLLSVLTGTGGDVMIGSHTHKPSRGESRRHLEAAAQDLQRALDLGGPKSWYRREARRLLREVRAARSRV